MQTNCTQYFHNPNVLLFVFPHWIASFASTSGTSAPSLMFAHRCMLRCHCRAGIEKHHVSGKWNTLKCESGSYVFECPNVGSMWYLLPLEFVWSIQALSKNKSICLLKYGMAPQGHLVSVGVLKTASKWLRVVLFLAIKRLHLLSH